MIRVRQIKIDIKNDTIDNLLNSVSKKLKINRNDILSYKINKKSIDARKDIHFVYEVDIETNCNIKFDNDILYVEDAKYEVESNLDKSSKIVIIGSGPCGLFTAYMLASYGYKPIVIERGEEIDKRVKTVSEFWETNKLDTNSNVQFGEGGAGTFSDGKLNTQIKDKNNCIKEVLRIFVENGAPEEIIYDHMPHIGTDKLREVVKNMRNKIISLGGIFKYNSCLNDIIIENNKIKSIKVNDEIIDVDFLVLAVGHSARDTFRMLNSKGLVMSNKPFAVGLRIMHPQSLIDNNQYKEYAKYLRPASYKLIYNDLNRGVYSFCMCPGGYVVNASSELNRLVVNGMSNYDRASGVANSAIIATVTESDYGSNLFDGVKFQEKLETMAYKLGSSNIPIQRLEDYYNNKITTELGSFNPMIKGNYTFANLNLLFNDDINKSLKNAIKYFDSKIKGFYMEDSILAGVESRTSSPIRMYRDEELESNIKGIYPAGEGAGYAGGITSSAVDGIKVFEAIIKRRS